LKKNEEIVETLGERILGRVALQDVINPLTSEIIGLFRSTNYRSNHEKY
jgi:hypothetical protein